MTFKKEPAEPTSPTFTTHLLRDSQESDADQADPAAADQMTGSWHREGMAKCSSSSSSCCCSTVTVTTRTATADRAKVEAQAAGPVGGTSKTTPLPTSQQANDRNTAAAAGGGGGGAAAAAGNVPHAFVLLFSGCGFLGPFHCGVGSFVEEYLDQHSKLMRYGGESAGAIVAAALGTGIKMTTLMDVGVTYSLSCKTPFQMCGLPRHQMEHLSPDDAAWQYARGRLLIGVAQLKWRGCCPTWTPVRLTEFTGRKHGTDAVNASCHIPVVSSWRPYDVAGQKYFDGGLAEKFPDVSETPLVVAQHPKSGGPLPVRVLKVDAYYADGYDITPGIQMPHTWVYLQRGPDLCSKMMRLGYLRAALFFASLPPAQVSLVWRADAPAPTPALIAAWQSELQAASADMQDIMKGRKRTSSYAVEKRKALLRQSVSFQTLFDMKHHNTLAGTVPATAAASSSMSEPNVTEDGIIRRRPSTSVTRV